MFKQVYLFDGTPFLAFKDEDGEYQYPDDEWTEVPPPDGIYSPFYYNGNEWIGATREEWEEGLEFEEMTPDELKVKVSNLQKQLVLSNLNMTKLSQASAKSLEETKEIKEDLKELKDQVGNLLKEFTKTNKGSDE